MLSKKQITGAWRKGRIHIWLKQLSKIRGIKCEQVFLDAWQLRILTVFHFIRRFVVLFQKLPHNRTARGDGLVSNVSCVGNEDEYFLSTSDKSLGVFSSIDTFLTSLHLIIFNHDNVNDFCIYSQLRWDSLRTYRCVVANNSTNASPYCSGRTSTEWAIFGSPSMETIGTICWDVSKLICLTAPFVMRSWYACLLVVLCPNNL